MTSLIGIRTDIIIFYVPLFYQCQLINCSLLLILQHYGNTKINNSKRSTKDIIVKIVMKGLTYVEVFFFFFLFHVLSSSSFIKHQSNKIEISYNRKLGGSPKLLTSKKWSVCHSCCNIAQQTQKLTLMETGQFVSFIDKLKNYYQISKEDTLNNYGKFLHSRDATSQQTIIHPNKL